MSFAATEVGLPGLRLITARTYPDARGTFVESARSDAFRALGLPDFIQQNESVSHARGTLRGLHFQRAPHAQAKLVRVLAGAIFDVAVDIRPASSTFGQWKSVVLTAMSGEQLFVPQGYAHGFCTLEPDTVVAYRCDAYYAPESEGTILFSDPDLAISWPVAATEMAVSDKDARGQRFADFAAALKDAAP